VNTSSNGAPPACVRLTDADWRIIAQARELASLRTGAAIDERFPGWDSPGAAYAEAFGVSRHLLTELAAIAERVGGSEGTTRRVSIQVDVIERDGCHLGAVPVTN
jgi:hypothetical protein